MAAVTKLHPGTRVRLKVGFVSTYGKYHEPGLVGRIGKVDPFRFPDGILRIWVWWTKHQGAWVPVGAINRLKEIR